MYPRPEPVVPDGESLLERDGAGAVDLAQVLRSEAVSAAGSADGDLWALFIDYSLRVG